MKMEEKKGLGLFMLLIGFIFLFISLMTFWTVSINWDAIILIFNLPLLIFSISTIIFSIFLMYTAHLKQSLKGLILIIDGLVPIAASIYALADPGLHFISDVRAFITVPVLLVGAFVIIYGFFLLLGDKYVTIKLKRKLNKILGLIAIIIGALNTTFFVMVLIFNPSFMNQNTISIITWFLAGGVLIVFGFHLIIKKIESRKKK
jgi:hypothetical protein